MRLTVLGKFPDRFRRHMHGFGNQFRGQVVDRTFFFGETAVIGFKESQIEAVGFLLWRLRTDPHGIEKPVITYCKYVEIFYGRAFIADLQNAELHPPRKLIAIEAYFFPTQPVDAVLVDGSPRNRFEPVEQIFRFSRRRRDDPAEGQNTRTESDAHQGAPTYKGIYHRHT